MDDMYRDWILDHYKHPRNFGPLENPDISHQEDNPLCGDVITIQLKLKDGSVEAAGFQGRGCAISQASASILTEMLQGKSLKEVQGFGKEAILEALGIQINPGRIKCALLSVKTLQLGLAEKALAEGRWQEDD
jgi:nitrogen fixation NifU-like protein